MIKNRLLNYLVSLQVIVLCVVLFAPIAWMILASFKPRNEITKYPPELLFTPTLENYQQLFTRTDFLENTLNSFYVAGGSTLLGLLLAVPAAYAISWHRLVWPATLTGPGSGTLRWPAAFPSTSLQLRLTPSPSVSPKDSGAPWVRPLSARKI